MKTLFEKIGYKMIEHAVTEFYERAFSDVMIGHFFFNIDQKKITASQIKFVSSMLGSEEIQYDGMPIKKAHAKFVLRPAHFNRRQVIMAEVLSDLELDKELAEAWLDKEAQLKPLILNTPGPCIGPR